MKELLQQWAELEPSRCQPDEKSYAACDKKIYYGGDWMQVWDASSIFSYADIQAAVQEALEARNWQYEQRWYSYSKVAIIYPLKIAGAIRHEATTYAEALLTAYLEALEIQVSVSQGEN